jgi:hypothetical protein
MTKQRHERLILNGEKCSMAFCPPIPENLDNIIARRRYISSTACWRGYIGEWEIKEGKFYLNKISGRLKKVDAEPIFAEWFSGVIRIPKGEVILGVNMGFGWVYEKEIHIKIVKGIVVKQRQISNIGKKFDKRELVQKNLPGNENRFDGDDF